VVVHTNFGYGRRGSKKPVDLCITVRRAQRAPAPNKYDAPNRIVAVKLPILASANELCERVAGMMDGRAQWAQVPAVNGSAECGNILTEAPNTPQELEAVALVAKNARRSYTSASTGSPFACARYLMIAR
jgi:hypothetical protein